jgi:hypothetical protein
MEDDGRFLDERPPVSPGPERFKYASEEAKGERAKHEEDRRAHGCRFPFLRAGIVAPTTRDLVVPR